MLFAFTVHQVSYLPNKTILDLNNLSELIHFIQFLSIDAIQNLFWDTLLSELIESTFLLYLIWSVRSAILIVRCKKLLSKHLKCRWCFLSTAFICMNQWILDLSCILFNDVIWKFHTNIVLLINICVSHDIS